MFIALALKPFLFNIFSRKNCLFQDNQSHSKVELIHWAGSLVLCSYFVKLMELGAQSFCDIGPKVAYDKDYDVELTI